MNMHFRVSLMIRGGVGVMALLVGTFFAAQVQAACTAANPNASVVEDTPTADFTDNGDATVTHNLTGLMWKQCAEGLSGAGCATGTATLMNWSSALSVAASDTTAGYSDWRLPNQGELLSIVETCGFSPAINTTLFPNTPLSAYWSASSYVLTPAAAWVLDPSDGASGLSGKTNNSYVRLVRGGQSLDTFDALAPQLSAVAVSATGATDTTLAATSDIGATGYWLVVAQGSAAPTAAEVKAGVDYGAVTVTASGMDSMVAGVEKSFSVSGLTAGTAYDLYVVGYDDNNKALTYSPSKVAFTTAHDTTLASSSGGGALGLWFLISLLGTALLRRRRV